MMRQVFLTATMLTALCGSALAQNSDAIVALNLPEEMVPVIVLDEVNKGIRLTGESMPLKDVVQAIGADTFGDVGGPTALIRRANGNLGAYGGKSLSEIDKVYGGDGVVDPAPKITENTQREFDTNSTDGDAVPVIALEESKGGIRLTGEYVSRDVIVSAVGAEKLAEFGPPTALVRRPNGALSSYHMPLGKIDKLFGGDGIVGDTPDGIDPFARGQPIEIIDLDLENPWLENPEIDLDLENAFPADPPMELFPDDMSGQWRMAIVGTANEGCSAQVVAAGEAAGRSMFQSTATTQSPELVPSELIPDGQFDSGWASTGTDTWRAVMADVSAPNMATRSTLQMIKVSDELIRITGTMQFNMAAELAAIAGMAPNCTYRVDIEATR